MLAQSWNMEKGLNAGGSRWRQLGGRGASTP